MSDKMAQSSFYGIVFMFLVFSTSLRPASRSRLLATLAASHFEQLGASVELIDLARFPLPPCDGQSCYSDPNVMLVAEKIRVARGILMASPIYNFDVSSVAKNLVEVTGQAWREKTVGFLCAAGGRGSYMSIMGIANSLMLDFSLPGPAPVCLYHRGWFF